MDAVDLNFTYSIIGPPMSVTLGIRAGAPPASSAGVAITPDGRQHLGADWLEWWLLRHPDEWVGRARRRPTRARLWLERHALWLAGLSIVLLAAEGAALAWLLANA